MSKWGLENRDRGNYPTTLHGENDHRIKIERTDHRKEIVTTKNNLTAGRIVLPSWGNCLQKRVSREIAS